MSRVLIVLTGPAGSGKTEVLHRLAATGEATVDLEGLARHRGSAFGALDEPQPSHQAFQAAVRARLARPAARFWVEDEADYIGSVGLPGELVAGLRGAPVVEVIASRNERVARLAAAYAALPARGWLSAIEAIRARAGDAATAAAAAAVRNGDLDAAVSALLDYYDRGYRHRVAALDRPVLGRVRADELLGDLARTAGQETGSPACAVGGSSDSNVPPGGVSLTVAQPVTT